MPALKLVHCIFYFLPSVTFNNKLVAPGDLLRKFKQKKNGGSS